MNKVLNKLLELFIRWKYPGEPPYHRFFLKFRYISFFVQLKYILHDYVIKRPYKVIDYNREFGPELMTTLPFAYWHYKNGTLKKTISAKGTCSFYFFSPCHEEKYDQRTFEDIPIVEIPNSEDHVYRYNLQKWEKVPLKEQYTNDEFVYDQPLLVISNKYNIEWGQSPINFLDVPTLDKILMALVPHYQVVYNRPESGLIIGDNSEVYSLEEYDYIRERYPSVLLMQDLADQYPQWSFNELQLRVYANCERFISVQGGNSVLASYFGGTNIIFARHGFEIAFNSYKNLFPLYSEARILHADNYDDLLAIVCQQYDLSQPEV